MEEDKIIVDKPKAVKTIVKSLDTLLEKSGFEKVEEKEGVTSLDEEDGEDLINGLGEVYEHKTKDCKFVVNFFLDQGSENEYLADCLELNLYLNGKLIRKGGEYMGELHGSFEEPFLYQYHREDDPIRLTTSPDIVSRPLPERDTYLRPIGYIESKHKTGYDVSFERYLFNISEWKPDEIAVVINDAFTTLLELVEGDIEISKKSEKKSLEKRLEYDKIAETQDVKKVIKERNEEFWKDVNERYEFFLKINDEIHIDRMYRFITPRDIIRHIFLNAESYNADELQFGTYKEDFHIYMIKDQEKIEMLEGFPLQQHLLKESTQKEVPMGERVMDEIKNASGFDFSRIIGKATIVLYDKKYHVEKSLTETPYGEKVVIKFTK